MWWRNYDLQRGGWGHPESSQSCLPPAWMFLTLAEELREHWYWWINPLTWATETCSLQSFHMMLQWECRAAVSLTWQQNLCVSAWGDHTRENSWFPQASTKILQYSVRLFLCLACGYTHRQLCHRSGDILHRNSFNTQGSAARAFWRPVLVPVVLVWNCHLLEFKSDVAIKWATSTRIHSV